MLWNDRLVSVIVLCYQNEDKLCPTLESIFKQDYARLEIIISDDGSDNFDINKWDTWSSAHKNENIEKIRILGSPINQGTVKNLRKSLNEISGEYYITLSPGDIFYVDNAVSLLMMCAAMHKHQELLIMGKAIHCDSKYSLRNEILSEDDYNVLRSRNAEELFQRLISTCCVTAISVLHRKDFPEYVNGYDTDYRYYEDYPTYLRMARKGITPLFIDKVVTLHLMGGIANGAIDLSLEIIDGFHRDCELLYKKDIKPYLKGQPINVIAKLAVRREKIKSQYLSTCLKKSGKIQRFLIALKHPGRLYFYQYRGILLVERLFRASIWSLLFLSLLKSSRLVSGALGNFIECVLLFFSLFGFATYLIHRLVWVASDVWRIWIRTLAETKK